MPSAPKGDQLEKAIANWKTLPSDEDAVFDRMLTIDTSRIAPQVTWGNNREIKKIMPEARVIICSGYAPEEMTAKLRDEMNLFFLQKPFSFSKLKEAVASQLLSE